jgi:hypothetical protein
MRKVKVNGKFSLQLNIIGVGQNERYEYEKRQVFDQCKSYLTMKENRLRRQLVKPFKNNLALAFYVHIF